MKKIMFALVAAGAAAVMADAIESANVVGYVDHSMADGRKEMKGQPFQMTSGAAVNLNDLVPMNGSAVCDHGQFRLWWWNTDTNWGDKRMGNKYATWCSYYYDENDPQADEGFVWDVNCWAYFAADDDQGDMPLRFVGDYAKTFEAGEGFFVQPACANPKLVCSGEVIGSGDTVNAMRKVGYVDGQKQLVTPPFPVSVALNDIVPMNGNVICDHGQFKLWWWNTDTSWGDKRMGNKYATWCSYYYDENDPQSDEGFVWDVNCWAYFAADDDQGDMPLRFVGDYAKTFAVGEGFYVQPACANPYLAFPNPFYVAE